MDVKSTTSAYTMANISFWLAVLGIAGPILPGGILSSFLLGLLATILGKKSRMQLDEMGEMGSIMKRAKFAQIVGAIESGIVGFMIFFLLAWYLSCVLTGNFCMG